MINYTELIGKKVFHSNNLKEAYKKAVKWYSTYVISKEKLKGGIIAEFEKNKVENTITIYLHVNLDESEIKNRHCKICKESHKLFYINEQYNCSACKMLSYRKRMKEAAKIKKNYYSNLILTNTDLEDE